VVGDLRRSSPRAGRPLSLLKRARAALGAADAGPPPAASSPAASPPAADPTGPATLGGHPVVEGAITRAELDYPLRPVPRWGHDRPRHEKLGSILDAGRERYREHLGRILALRGHLARVPVGEPADPTEPYWLNGWLPGLDAAALYAFLAHGDPATYLEVGSGNSTRWARRAIGDHGLRTRIVSIDPSPRAEIDSICDEVLRAPAEDVDPAFFDRLGPGDVLFVDNSHRCLQNSDATAVFLDVLPRLPAGVLVEVHDVFLPDDYPPEWADRLYSEQYILAAYLLAPGSQLEAELPAWYLSTDPELGGVLDPLWDDVGLERDRHGGSFWFRTA